MRSRAVLAAACASMGLAGTATLGVTHGYFSGASTDAVAVVSDQVSRWLTVADAADTPVPITDAGTADPLVLTTRSPLPESVAALKVAAVAVAADGTAVPGVAVGLVAGDTALAPDADLPGGQTYAVRLTAGPDGDLAGVAAVRFTISVPDGSVLVDEQAVKLESAPDDETTPAARAPEGQDGAEPAPPKAEPEPSTPEPEPESASPATETEPPTAGPGPAATDETVAPSTETQPEAPAPDHAPASPAADPATEAPKP